MIAFFSLSLLSLTNKKLMFTTYILQSAKSGRFYIGHTEDIESRLYRHNSGMVTATRNKGPWRVVLLAGARVSRVQFQKTFINKRSQLFLCLRCNLLHYYISNANLHLQSQKQLDYYVGNLLFAQ